jgi:hypothetical protein
MVKNNIARKALSSFHYKDRYNPIKRCKKNIAKTAQLGIQKMAFMIIAVFLFFIFVGLFFLSWQYKDVREGYEELEKEQTISYLSSISDISELNCKDNSYLCLDEDKLKIMSGLPDLEKQEYKEIWPVSSIKVYKIYPSFESLIKCPGLNCNYYEVYDSNQESSKEFSTYVLICKKISYSYTKCEIGKLSAGVKS